MPSHSRRRKPHKHTAGKTTKRKKSSLSDRSEPNAFGSGIVLSADESSPTRSKEPIGPPSHEELQDPKRYFSLLRQWLEWEGQAERERMAVRRQQQRREQVEKTGETILTLEIVDHHTGLAGRWLLDLAKPGGQELPMNRLKVGSPIVLSDDGDLSDDGIAGVVSRRKPNTIQIATEKWPEGTRFRLDLSPDETTRRRQLAACAKSELAIKRTGKLRDVILGTRPARFTDLPDIEFLTDLNASQCDAVKFALSAQDVAILHGPPGTGKTTTVAEVIYQAVLRGDRVLACASSNTAVDNLLEKLVGMMENVVRVGHPARVFEALRGHTLDERVDSDPTNAVIADMRREVDDLMRAAQRRPSGRDGFKRRGQLFAEAGQLRGQIRALERSIVRSVLDSADVICTTTTIDDDLLGSRNFQLVVLDEACQCTEPGIWQAVLRADCLVLAGDHCQLPPTVLSDTASRAGLKRSTMQRLIEREGKSIFRRLSVQYRMHEAIMRFSSDAFYEGELVADESVRQRLLFELDGVSETDLTDSPIALIDTAGAEFTEELEPDGQSKLNPGEGRLVTHLVNQSKEAGIPSKDIAVIAPYAAQVRWIRARLHDSKIEVDTVDGFQGREKEVVIITMTRSNEQGEIGFLADTRRTNVALTRAKRKLIVIGDSATLGNHPFYAQLLEHFENAGAYQSVWEYSAELGI